MTNSTHPDTDTTRTDTNTPADAYIDLLPGPDTKNITCWSATDTENSNTHKYRVETTQTTGEQQTAITEITGETDDFECWEIKDTPQYSAFRLGLVIPHTEEPPVSVTITDTDHIASISLNNDPTNDTTETDDQRAMIENAAGNSVIIDVRNQADTVTCRETTTRKKDTVTFTIEHDTEEATESTPTDAETESETEDKTDPPTVEAVQEQLPDELECWGPASPSTTRLASGVKITPVGENKNGTVGELTYTPDTEPDHRNYTVELHKRSHTQNDTEYFTDSREYHYTHIENALATITDFITDGMRPEYQVTVNLSEDAIDRERLEYTDTAKHIVTNNNIQREVYVLSRLAGTDVWEFRLVNQEKSFNDPAFGMELLGTGILELTPPKLPDDETQAVTEAVMSDKMFVGWDELRLHLTDIINTFNKSLDHHFREHIMEEIKDDDGRVNFSVGEQIIVYTPNENAFERLIRESIETALGNTGVAFDTNITKTLTSIFTEHLKETQANSPAPTGHVSAKVRFTANTWTQRAVKLNVLGGVPWQAANVAALKEEGHANKDIAETLNIDESTVSRHVDTISRRITEATWLTENTNSTL